MLLVSINIQKFLWSLHICALTVMSKCHSCDMMYWVGTRERLALEAVAADRICQNYR